MKKRFAFATFAALVIALGTVAFVPSVRAQMGELFNSWFRFEVPGLDGEIAMPAPTEFTPLQPTYLPAGFQSASMHGSGSAQTIEFTYFGGEQFVTLAQRKAFADKSLPAGQKVTVKGQPAVMVTGLKGTIDYGSKLPENAQAKTFGTPPAEPANAAKPIAYTDGKRLTWYVGDVRAELLSNLSEAEIVKIAESLAPAKPGEGRPPYLPDVTPDPAGSGSDSGVIKREGPIDSKPDSKP